MCKKHSRISFLLLYFKSFYSFFHNVWSNTCSWYSDIDHLKYGYACRSRIVSIWNEKIQWNEIICGRLCRSNSHHTRSQHSFEFVWYYAQWNCIVKSYLCKCMFQSKKFETFLGKETSHASLAGVKNSIFKTFFDLSSLVIHWHQIKIFKLISHSIQLVFVVQQNRTAIVSLFNITLILAHSFSIFLGSWSEPVKYWLKRRDESWKILMQ